MTSISSFLTRSFRAYQVFGANTDVGKTVFSTILCRTVRQRNQERYRDHKATVKPTKIWYLKPVSTGAADDADIQHLHRFVDGDESTRSRSSSSSSGNTGSASLSLVTQNLWQLNDAVSPHIAAANKNTTVSDDLLLERVHAQILANANQSTEGFMLVETAGGPHSPGPSGSSQVDIYRPLRLPTLFIADYRLGGISTSISSYESLRLRGYDIDGVAVFKETYYRNFEYFQEYFQDRNIPLLVVPTPPERSVSAGDDQMAMRQYYNDIAVPGNNSAMAFEDSLQTGNEERISRLESLAVTAEKHIWYPFTQHTTISANSLTVIDSAYGDYFQTLKRNQTGSESLTDNPQNMLQSTLDASASWWTQGLGHANPALTMAAASAAGRYGHVMFASAVHEPALDLAVTLLETVNNPRLQRTFYSDNGSTGMEVAIKMAIVAAARRYGWTDQESRSAEIIGLKGSYHGDTLGTVDMSEPSVFNERIPWYRGRGFWFDPPSVQLMDGKWVIVNSLEDVPMSYAYDSLDQIFDTARDSTDTLVQVYARIIREQLEHAVKVQGRRFGALVMEPVVLGAGGMILVDPLFQRTLVKVVRSSTDLFSQSSASSSSASSTARSGAVAGDKDWAGLPYVADEVFTGLWRLGHASSSNGLLQVESDISVHAKLLTGGLMPLAITLASESIFKAFLGDSKADALLHGHSYTAHAVGCSVANESLKLLKQQAAPKSSASSSSDTVRSTGASKGIDGAWDAFRASWAIEDPEKGVGRKESQVWSVWHPNFLEALTMKYKERVSCAWALGSVLAIFLKDPQGASGYASNAAVVLQRSLLQAPSDSSKHGAAAWNIHSRVLGNVLYIMTSQISTEPHVRAWEARMLHCLSNL